MRWSIRFPLAPRELRCRPFAVAARSNETHSCFRRSPPRSFAHRRSTRYGSLCRRLGIGQQGYSHRDSLGGSSPSRTGECCCGEAIARVTQSAGCGTEYIQTKARCLQDLETHQLADRIIAVFPTLVFGGRVDGTSVFPTSYLTEGLAEASRWLWLARWLRADASFHFIHAEDIARICGQFALRPHEPNKEPGQGRLRRVVMGQQAISVDQTVATLCRWRGVRRTPGVPMWPWLIQALIRILPIEINDWDRFSIRQRHFIHSPASTPERFGGTSHAPNLETVLIDSGLPNRGKPRRSRKVGGFK